VEVDVARGCGRNFSIFTILIHTWYRLCNASERKCRHSSLCF